MRSPVYCERLKTIPVTAANKKDTFIVFFLLAEIIVAIREPVQAERLVYRVQRGASRGRSKFCLWQKATKSKMRSPVYCERLKTIPVTAE